MSRKKATKAIVKPLANQLQDFLDLSKRLELCVGVVAKVSGQFRDFPRAGRLPASCVDHVVGTLQGLYDQLQLIDAGLRPHLRSFQAAAGSQRGDSVCIPGQKERFITWHEAALHFLTAFCRDLDFTLPDDDDDPDHPKKLDNFFTWTPHFDESAVRTNIRAVVTFLASRPEFDDVRVQFNLAQERDVFVGIGDAELQHAILDGTRNMSKIGGGRKPDPKIGTRDQKIIKMFKEGKSHNEINERFPEVSVANSRRIKSDARKRGEL